MQIKIETTLSESILFNSQRQTPANTSVCSWRCPKCGKEVKQEAGTENVEFARTFENYTMVIYRVVNIDNKDWLCEECSKLNKRKLVRHNRNLHRLTKRRN
jgi:ribosomal protein L37AE/L43A